LKSRRDIDRLFDNGRRISGEHATILWEKSDRFAYGVFLSGKSGPATARNRIKRLFREAIRFNRHVLGGAVRVAVVPKARTKEPQFKAVNAELGRLFTLVQSRASQD
jgi:ribonuclease P protein component